MCTLQGGALDNQNSPPLNVACSSRQTPSIIYVNRHSTPTRSSAMQTHILSTIYPNKVHPAIYLSAQPPPRTSASFLHDLSNSRLSFPYLFTIWEFHYL
jgi:hypothetical protein